MSYLYSVSVAPMGQEQAALKFEVESHDDLLAIVERVRSMAVVPASEAPAFALGIKLFAETFMRHRREPLFADLVRAFPAFMKRLKAHDPAA